MSNLVIYDSKRQLLSEVGFIKDTPNHIKIRDINNSYELQKQAGIVFAVCANHLGLKEEIPQISKVDIMELILSRFKNLSMDEVAYAFKLERYGSLGDRVEHYQLFNASYVSDVLSKYVKWKADLKAIHSISTVYKEVKVSDEEKAYWINRGINNCLDSFIDTGLTGSGSFNVYDVLYDLGYLPTDKAYKAEILKAAIECIQIEQSLLRSKSLITPKQMRAVFEKIKNTKDSIVVIKCKELVLSQFFRELQKDSDRLKDFRDTFKVIGNYE